MRFVSNSARLHCGNFRNEQEAIGASREVVVDGVRRVANAQAYTVSPAIPIRFSQENLMQADVDAAKAHWKKWPGITLDEDRITLSDPTDRVGVWDSVEWQKQYGLTDEERQEAEQMLLQSTVHGISFIEVKPVVKPKPWPTYDKTHHSKIADLAAELGVVSEALTYERENKNRPSVVAALEEKVSTIETPEGDLVSA